MNTTIDELKQFCFYFYHIQNLPIYLYQEHEKVLQYPELPEDINPITIYLKDIFSSNRDVFFLVTKQFVYYGIVKIKGTSLQLIIGPVSSTFCSTNALKSIMNDAAISYKKIIDFTEFFQQVPVISFSHFLNVLCFLHYTCNHESIMPEQLWDFNNHKDDITTSEMYAANYFLEKEEKYLHNTHKFENEYLSYIEQGDIAGLKDLFQKPFTLRTGIVADNNIRQTKNLFIASTTLATRSAVRGGLDIETAYQLSDIYIRQMEKLVEHDLINSLQFKMILDFTERVMEAKIPPGISTDIYECMHYISTHTNEPITVTDISKHVNRSRSHLSRKFKEELGFDISTFIMRRKLEEAKSLLTFTEKSISEISNYLCFSSQSYFQNVFKKKYGITPKKYREKNIH